LNERFMKTWITLSLVLALSLPAQAAERAIDKSIDVPATLDEAWAAWTTREGITSFFAPDAEIDARVGGAFHIHIDPARRPAARAPMTCVSWPCSPSRC
jgi:uncharacterized protein YndB with AHSA1/START domain